MNKFLKALLISVALFGSHILILFVMSIFYDEPGAINYGIVGSAVYIFIVAFWAYYCLTLMYLFISRSITGVWNKIIISLIVMLIGYILSRVGDFIDGDFVEKFRIVPFTLFILSSILLVSFDCLYTRMTVNKT